VMTKPPTWWRYGGAVEDLLDQLQRHSQPRIGGVEPLRHGLEAHLMPGPQLLLASWAVTSLRRR
jgi:hypothetical protein